MSNNVILSVYDMNGASSLKIIGQSVFSNLSVNQTSSSSSVSNVSVNQTQKIFEKIIDHISETNKCFVKAELGINSQFTYRYIHIVGILSQFHVY